MEQTENTTFTEEQLAAIQAKADELTEREKRKVHYFVTPHHTTGEPVVAYVKDPPYLGKLVFLDEITGKGAIMAGNKLAEQNILAKDSHPLMSGNDAASEPYRLGLAVACVSLLEMYSAEFKKK